MDRYGLHEEIEGWIALIQSLELPDEGFMLKEALGELDSAIEQIKLDG